MIAPLAYHFDGSDNVVDGRRTGDVFAQNVAAEWGAPDDADSPVKSGQRRPLQEPDGVGRQRRSHLLIDADRRAALSAIWNAASRHLVTGPP